MLKRPLTKLLCAVAAAIGLSASLTASAADPLKVGFVYIGPIGDHGGTYQHEQGRKALAEKFGNQITTNYVENVAEGADAERVIRNRVFQHTDSPAPIQAAERRGVYAVGYASDMAYFGPKAVLTSIVNDWGPHYIQAAQSVLDHQWKSQDYWGGLKEGTVELPISDLVPAPVKAEVEQIIADIKSGALHPFTGPSKDQAGVEKIAAGATASNAELASMNYYVEGMKADIPK